MDPAAHASSPAMSVKMKIIVKLVPVEQGPSDLKDTVTFALIIDSTNNFFQVWKLILQRYEDNYASGRSKFVASTTICSVGRR